MATMNELRAAYPYMFAGQNIGHDVPSGWMPLFAQVCADIDSILGQSKRGFHWGQFKEKFGGARWYYSMDRQADDRPSTLKLAELTEEGDVIERTIGPPARVPKTARESINNAVDAACAQTFLICIACGAPASKDGTDGYWLRLCAEHSAMRRNSPQKFERITWGSDDV